jgi:hypothetical protein
MPNIEFIVQIGMDAQRCYSKEAAKNTLAETVDYLPHPLPKNRF